MEYVVGIDIGATSTKLMIMDRMGGIVEKKVILTAVDSPENTLSQIAGEARDLISLAGREKQIAAIGVGIPGPTNCRDGIAYYVPNLDWRNVAVATFFKRYFECPALIENDGNINLLGECRFGAGIGVRDAVLITLGTGIGGGILVQNTVLRGADCLAGEIGHMVIGPAKDTCSCGQTGCFESYCSGKAILHHARDVLKCNTNSILLDVTGGDLNRLTVEMVFNGYREQDACCTQVVKRFLEYLVIGVTNLIHIFNPQKIIIGGGISHAGDIILPPLQQTVCQRIMDRRMECDVCCGTLFEDAGSMGACSLALTVLNR